MWNLCVLALFAALIATRLLLVIANWSDVVKHPAWILSLAMVHHPLLALAGGLAGAAAAAFYAFKQRLPLLRAADALAAPLALGMACEQMGALLAGSGYGTETSVRWAVTYSSVLAARWSGTPLGVPLHPVQGYAALAYLAVAVGIVFALPLIRRPGDAAGLWSMATGAAIFLTELARDREGRGALLDGTLDGPQIAAIVLMLLGAFLLCDRKLRTKAAEATQPGTEVANG
jgi:phosphatidylglycerol:prolipoprotein diacylglycerol transferase